MILSASPPSPDRSVEGTASDNELDEYENDEAYYCQDITILVSRMRSQWPNWRLTSECFR
jgi:hypothetical protein